jgi:cysteine-rich repeat protein
MDCGTGPGDTLDSDHDGVCNGVDQCVGGDDCLVRYWANPDPCPDASDPDMSLCECNLASCGCDCDRFGGADLCQAAIRFNCETLGLCEPDQGDNDTEDGIEDTDYNGIPQCAEDTFAPTLCIPVPSKCDLLVDTDPAGNPVDVFLLDFRESIGSASAATWLTNKGWHLSDPHAEGALLISATGSDFQDGMPDGAHECQLATGTGYLEIGTPSDLTQVDAIWFLETKAFAFPPITHCAIAERREWDWPNWVCVPSNCPTVGRWSFMSIDVVLQIINDGTGRDWELAVLDGCTPSDQERERLRLAFVDEPYACSSPQNCLVENGTCDCGGKIHVVQYGADGVPYPSSDDLPYRHGQWFRLRVTLDNTSGYWIDNGVCRFRHLTTATEWPPESVRVRIQRHEGDSECYTRSLGLLSETYLGSGPATASDEVRGIRIRFTSSNEGGGTMRVGAIQFRPTDGCELAVGPGPLPHLPWPCSQEDPCHCDDARSWYCQADMDDCNYRCGNRWQDADEECDPPNTASCSESCHWVCGDGILQGLNTAHCSLLGWPANGHCGAGTEECDDGNTTNGDGCSADCDLEAP